MDLLLDFWSWISDHDKLVYMSKYFLIQAEAEGLPLLHLKLSSSAQNPNSVEIANSKIQVNKKY